MKQRINEKNINTKEYLDTLYKTPDYMGHGYDDARRRIHMVVDQLPKVYKHLDIGCADGEFTKYYLEKYPDSEGFGMDISEEALVLARKNCPHGTFLDVIFNDVDLIHCGEVLEHLEDPQKMIDMCYRALNKKGLLVITTPNELAEEYEEHLWKWDMQSIKDMLGKFTIVKEDPRFFNGHLLFIEAQKI